MKAYYYLMNSKYNDKPLYRIMRRITWENGDKMYDILPMSYINIDAAIEVSSLLNEMEEKELHES